MRRGGVLVPQEQEQEPAPEQEQEQEHTGRSIQAEPRNMRWATSQPARLIARRAPPLYLCTFTL
jgi:hypothetical protein